MLHGKHLVYKVSFQPLITVILMFIHLCQLEMMLKEIDFSQTFILGFIIYDLYEVLLEYTEDSFSDV